MVPTSRSPMPSAALQPSSTLWATASKEWVIPAKPKPGRKPKKESPTQPHDDVDEADPKGRRVQNRAAQRAFRERKQNQLADLQARVQLYEQGEIERNVALQSISKRLKEENEILKRENARLFAEVANLRAKYSKPEDRKRHRSEESLDTRLDDAQKKKLKAVDSSASGTQSPAPTSALSLVSSPSPLASSPESCTSVQSVLSPLSYSTPANSAYLLKTSTSNPPHISLNTVNVKGVDFTASILDSIVDCGFCSEDTSCVCRELALQQAASAFTTHEQITAIDAQGMETKPPQRMSSAANQEGPVIKSPRSILENLPAFQPALPLRRRSGSKKVTEPIFRVVPSSSKVPMCSGDPTNCAVCADDPFGQAFCAAFGDAVASNGTCSNCPRDECSADSSSSSCVASPSSITVFSPPSNSRLRCSEDDQPSETMSRSDAWKQIKRHPNAQFADLRFLAEVVARKSTCPGPSMDIFHSPASTTRISTPDDNTKVHKIDPYEENAAIILTDPHARYHQMCAVATASRQSEAPSLVPEAVLIKCGRERVLEVQAEGVRDALRLLDSRFGTATCGSHINL